MEVNNNADRDALLSIKNDCDMIYKHIERLGVSRETMSVDQTCLDAVSKRIENIGETVYGRLSEQFKDKHNEFDWHVISGMRHRLVHRYQDAKWNIVVDVTYDEIPKLRSFCIKILREYYNIYE